jgi:hypothetical protein
MEFYAPALFNINAALEFSFKLETLWYEYIYFCITTFKPVPAYVKWIRAGHLPGQDFVVP